MPDLSFQIEGAEAVAHAAAPLLTLKLRVSNAVADEPIQSLALQCQIQIEPTRRRYSAPEQNLLRDLFGEPERWGKTVRSMLWSNINVPVSSFTESRVVDVPVPCTFDFNIAATKYFHGLEGGEVPLCVLFSGTIFYTAEDGRLQISQIPWDREANYRLPVQVWRKMMDIYYPNIAWLCLRRDVFDRFYEYKVRHGISTWEQAQESILVNVEESVKS